MTSLPLYARHPAGLASQFADLENHAAAQTIVLAGTPGSITVRTNGSGASFYSRQYYDYHGRKKDQYIASGPGTPEADRLAEEWRNRLADGAGVIKTARLLFREGYAPMSPRHFASLVPLVNHGLFNAGAMLVGTHAFEAIANKMGIRVAAFATEDVDVARPARLALRDTPPGGLLQLLRESGIDFFAVPPLERGHPPVKFAEKGRSRFTFDLIAPARGKEIQSVAVPELGTHAVALPHFGYLVAEAQSGIVLSRHGIAAIQMPLPERFALHKMIVSQLRTGRAEKSLKDLRQAAVLIAATCEMHPGAIAEAAEKLTRSERGYARKSVARVAQELERHPQSLEELRAALATT
jgi:hypothetical protein